MTPSSPSSKVSDRELVVGWSAVVGAALAVTAWAACCVLPMALSVAGLGLLGTGFIAGQRGWLTAGAAVLVAAGWWTIWRRRRSCARDASCQPQARLMVGLLSVATTLIVAALIWAPLIEPGFLALLRAARG